jgi:hypothetical protein
MEEYCGQGGRKVNGFLSSRGQGDFHCWPFATYCSAAWSWSLLGAKRTSRAGCAVQLGRD